MTTWIEIGALNDIPVLGSRVVHADETPIALLDPGGGKTKKATNIKSHHNVGGLPETLHLKLLEPLRELFKDEVRELGALLGLPPEIIWRQPFPGPGLAIRVLGEVSEERLAVLREADAIVQDEVRRAGLEQPASVVRLVSDVALRNGPSTLQQF